jgi:hypothetical protein
VQEGGGETTAAQAAQAARRSDSHHQQTSQGVTKTQLNPACTCGPPPGGPPSPGDSSHHPNLLAGPTTCKHTHKHTQQTHLPVLLQCRQSSCQALERLTHETVVL